MNKTHLHDIIKATLKEDIGRGDLTSEIIFENGSNSRGQFIAKDNGIVCGLQIIDIVYRLLWKDIEVVLHKRDGDTITKGDIIADVNGNTRTLLTAERTILNIIQHMCGIASVTADTIKALDDDTIRVCDTRKTLPGLRMLQKYAVTCGGGFNHRYRLDDGVMIKDNHIKASGSISKAVKKTKDKLGHMVKVEVETETREQVLESIEAGADVIMFDNRSPEEVKEWTQIVPEGIITEVSGGITPETIAAYKGCGVDYISLGWLTHSVKALDISFNLIDSEE